MKVLFIVEHDFLRTHVGVRRVITHYIDQVGNAGHEVALSAMVNGQLTSGAMSWQVAQEQQPKTFRPHWSSAASARQLTVESPSVQEKTLTVSWTGQTADPDQFDLCVITTPWLCAEGLPPIKHSIGIVYDLVPNLLALDCLRFPAHLDIYRFAHQHDAGFKYYIDHCQQVLCISQSTLNDLLKLYPEAKRIPHLFVDIPFPAKGRLPGAPRTSGSILLVNALDWRKNFKGIERILTTVATRRQGLDVNLVGRERIPMHDVMAFLSSLANKGVEINWFRDADEAVLLRLYQTSDMLLFPSLYEGLGLPILEAQATGLPVISSDNSSCREINMNRGLAFEASDEAGMTEALLSHVTGQADRPQCLRDAALVDAQLTYLSEASQGLIRALPGQGTTH